jgi:chromosome segregation ATPase
VVALTRILAATRAVTARAGSLQQTVAGLESQIADLKGQLENAAAGMQRAESDGRACAAAKTEVESRLLTVTQERDNVRAELAARWSASAGLLAGIAISALVCLAWWLVRRRSA